MTDRRDLPPALVAEAKKEPGGWIYEIAGDYGPDDAVPSTAIRDAWKVGDDGQIVGGSCPIPCSSRPLDERSRRPDRAQRGQHGWGRSRAAARRPDRYSVAFSR